MPMRTIELHDEDYWDLRKYIIEFRLSLRTQGLLDKLDQRHLELLNNVQCVVGFYNVESVEMHHVCSLCVSGYITIL